MNVLVAILTLVALAALVAAMRTPAPPEPGPGGGRLIRLGLLLAAATAAFWGFVAFHLATGWGVRDAVPPGPVVIVQLARAALLLAALRTWLAIAAPELTTRTRWLTGAIVAALGWIDGARPLAVVGALVIVGRMRWPEAVRGWRRLAGLAAAVVLLVALSFLPHVAIGPRGSDVAFALGADPWPPGLLPPEAVGAARELALARPLDRLAQGIVDLMRVQLAVAAFRFLMLPLRFTGVSLRRRFFVNFVLVRSIPAALSALTLLGLGWLALGHHRAQQVRGAFDATLARAETAAAAAASLVREAPPAARAARLERARSWLGADSTVAALVWRDSGGVVATFGASPAMRDGRALAAADSFRRGMVVADGALALALRSAGPADTAEVYVRVDDAALARASAPTRAEARLVAQPNTFVTAGGIRVTGDTSWTSARVLVHAPRRDTSGARRWLLSRTFLPIGDWSAGRLAPERGAVELTLESTARGFLAGLVALLPGVAPNAFAVLIVVAAGVLISIVETIAVRSGRSILKSVLEEFAALRAAAERFGRGDLDYRLPVHGRDEFGVVASSFNDMAASLARQRAELAAKERLEQDLAVARDIQRRLLPQAAPRIAGLDVAARATPSREVGGDLIDHRVRGDGAVVLALGDVSGKSVPAALLMSNVLAALRAQAAYDADPATTLTRTNALVAEQVEPGRFVTLFLGELSADHGELRYSSAGHNPPLLVRADGRIEWLGEGGVPLGVLPQAEYPLARVGLAPGDTLVVYSDGVTEAERADGALFGEERLAASAVAARGAGAGAVLDRLLADVAAFVNGAPASDDLTVLVVRRGEGNPT